MNNYDKFVNTGAIILGTILFTSIYLLFFLVAQYVNAKVGNTLAILYVLWLVFTMVSLILKKPREDN